MFNKPLDFPVNQNILYCCLYWGLGHATRSVPIIEELLAAGNKVTIASDGMALTYLKEEFPNLPIIHLPAYNISYPFQSFVFNMVIQSSKIWYAIYKESKLVSSLQKKHKFDVIISDNRPGCFHNTALSIFVTHQLMPYHSKKWMAYFFYKLHNYYYKNFNSIWVPDDLNSKLSGTLSNYHFNRPKVAFIGIISRLKKDISKPKTLLTVVLSGPEPQRSHLENIVYKCLIKYYNGPICFIRGSNNLNAAIVSTSSITIYNLMGKNELQDILNASKLVIARSGYTTLMDLYELGLEAIIIPTPGQTEQEYLGQLHSEKWQCIDQKNLTIELPLVLSKL